jgi:hypothetical protein
MIIHIPLNQLYNSNIKQPLPLEVFEELLDMIRVLTNSTLQVVESTQQVVEIMKAHPKQEADILKEEEEECQNQLVTSPPWTLYGGRENLLS